MSYEKVRKKKKRSKILRTSLFLAVLLVLIFRSVPTILANNTRTILPEKGVLIDTISGDGIIIKKEEVVKAKSDGIVEKVGLEGERLSSGSTVLVLNTENDSSALKQELEQIEESIAAIKESENEIKIISDEKHKVEDAKGSLADEIQDSINNGNYNEVHLLKEKILLFGEKASDLDSHLLGTSIENLEKKKKEINETINSNHMKYYTGFGGILSYEIDGYEDLLIPKEFENYTYEKLDLKPVKEKSKDSNKVVLDEGIYKLIDNFEWYLAIKIKDIKEIEDFQPNKMVNLSIGKDKTEMKGQIVEINVSEKGGVIIVKLNTMLHEYYNIRFSEVKIIKSKKEGYKIPSTTIVDNNGVEGVYIKEKNGIVKFRPVIIIGQDSDYTYVDVGDLNGFINIEGQDKPVKTVDLYDDVFNNTKNIKEGQILN